LVEALTCGRATQNARQGLSKRYVLNGFGAPLVSRSG